MFFLQIFGFWSSEISLFFQVNFWDYSELFYLFWWKFTCFCFCFSIYGDCNLTAGLSLPQASSAWRTSGRRGSCSVSTWRWRSRTKTSATWPRPSTATTTAASTSTSSWRLSGSRTRRAAWSGDAACSWPQRRTSPSWRATPTYDPADSKQMCSRSRHKLLWWRTRRRRLAQRGSCVGDNGGLGGALRSRVWRWRFISARGTRETKTTQETFFNSYKTGIMWQLHCN